MSRTRFIWGGGRGVEVTMIPKNVRLQINIDYSDWKRLFIIGTKQRNSRGCGESRFPGINQFDSISEVILI